MTHPYGTSINDATLAGSGAATAVLFDGYMAGT